MSFQVGLNIVLDKGLGTPWKEKFGSLNPQEKIRSQTCKI